MDSKIKQSDVVDANVYIHTALVDIYDEQPHFRPENKAKVSAILHELRQSVAPIVQGPSRLLDMGCGTGFLISIAEQYFDELHGVDITPAMLSKIDISSGKIKLHNVPAENTPLEDNYFDTVTAYSFMDHLYELEPFLKEVYRVLKPGGIFYTDQNASRAFWEVVGKLDVNAIDGYSPIIQREMTTGLRAEQEFAKKRDIDTEAFRIAEYIKSQQNGIEAGEVADLARKIGFSQCVVRYDWYLGEGKLLHGKSADVARLVGDYLREVGPLADHLFKYLRFDIKK